MAALDLDPDFSIMRDLKVLFEDDSLVAVDKPAGLLSVPGRGPEKADCVVSRAGEKYGWIREVHRLDQATSGILLLARNPDAHRFLSAAFASRDVEKIYAAETVTLPEDPALDGVIWEDGRITVFQRLDTENRPHQIIDPVLGKESVTEWRLLETGAGQSGRYRIELRPLTGRTHQLRLVLSLCAAAIPGDSLYAPPEIKAASPRLLLHAEVLRFHHPDSNALVEINSPASF